MWILRGMRSLRSESAVTHEEKTNSLCNPGGTEVSLPLGFGILSEVSQTAVEPSHLLETEDRTFRIH